ncbi:MAG TPA: polysaccharide biosynthesis/export family protein [Opitutaceae bacterium]
MNLIIKSLAACAIGLLCLAQSRADDATANPGGAKVYNIRATDKLRITVFQEDDLSTVCRVDAKGTVNLPLVGEVRVRGLTLDEAQGVIEKAYKDGRFLRKPDVTVAVDEYAPREVSIQGQVKNPGRYPLPIEATMSVIDLVTKAGGFTDTAQGTAVRVTRVLPDGTTKVISLDVESQIKGKNSGKGGEAFLLEPDDIVYVPERII